MYKPYKQYIPSLVSIMCVFFYFTPWLIEANRTNLGLYIISVLWFFIAWIIAIIRTIGIIRQLYKKSSLDKHKIFSVLLIALCYFILVIAWSNHYIVTV